MVHRHLRQLLALFVALPVATWASTGGPPPARGPKPTPPAVPAPHDESPVAPAQSRLPFDQEGNLRVSTTPKSMTLDTGEMEITEGQFPVGTIDLEQFSTVPVQGHFPMGAVNLDGYDCVSVQLVSLSGPGRIEIHPEWRNGDAPFTDKAQDCIAAEGGSENCVDLALHGSVLAWPGQSAIKHFNVVARELQLSVMMNAPGVYRFRIVLYARRTG